VSHRSTVEEAKKLRAYIAEHPGVTCYELVHAAVDLGVTDLDAAETVLERQKLIRIEESKDGNHFEDKYYVTAMEVPK
jgi:hypothetical protein